MCIFSFEKYPRPNLADSQGVISVILVMDEFLDRFPEVSDHASGAGFNKGLMTAMITLGAFIGELLKIFTEKIHDSDT